MHILSFTLAMFAMRLEGEHFVFFVDASVTSAYSREEAEQTATKLIEDKCKESDGWRQHMVCARKFEMERRHYGVGHESNAEPLVM